MRMEELVNNNFVKGTDSVERYLLDLVKQYFESSGITRDDSREYIIQKAVDRMREELYIDNAGVLSVNGKSGDVVLTIQDLNGEPYIEDKKTAFNVPFGTVKGTACEGNDPRLSDARKPTVHNHTISDVIGLKTELNSILNKINQLSNVTHKHDNKLVLDKLVYTGDKDIVDLTILDTVPPLIDEKIAYVESTTQEFKVKSEKLLTDITKEFTDYTNDYDNIQDAIKDNANQIKDEVTEYINVKFEEIDESIEKKADKETINNIINNLNKQYRSIYTATISDFIDSNNNNIEYTINLPDEITETLNDLLNSDIQIIYKLSYKDAGEAKKTTNLPWIYCKDGKITYTIISSFDDNSIIKLNASKTIQSWEDFMYDAEVLIDIQILNTLSEV